jgi:aldose 1-epimerase
MGGLDAKTGVFRIDHSAFAAKRSVEMVGRVHDHGGGGALARVALFCDPVSGRQMEVLSTQPAVVVYTANHFDGTLRGKGGVIYPKHAGLCVEPAHLPNAVNHPEWPFPPIVLRPGQTYRQTCVYGFSAR